MFGSGQARTADTSSTILTSSPLRIISASNEGDAVDFQANTGGMVHNFSDGTITGARHGSGEHFRVLRRHQRAAVPA